MAGFRRLLAKVLLVGLTVAAAVVGGHAFYGHGTGRPLSLPARIAQVPRPVGSPAAVPAPVGAPAPVPVPVASPPDHPGPIAVPAPPARPVAVRSAAPVPSPAAPAARPAVTPPVAALARFAQLEPCDACLAKPRPALVRFAEAEVSAGAAALRHSAGPRLDGRRPAVTPPVAALARFAQLEPCDACLAKPRPALVRFAEAEVSAGAAALRHSAGPRLEGPRPADRDGHAATQRQVPAAHPSCDDREVRCPH